MRPQPTEAATRSAGRSEPTGGFWWSLLVDTLARRPHHRSTYERCAFGLRHRRHRFVLGEARPAHRYPRSESGRIHTLPLRGNRRKSRSSVRPRTSMVEDARADVAPPTFRSQSPSPARNR
jgi:hypothetical protein